MTFFSYMAPMLIKNQMLANFSVFSIIMIIIIDFSPLFIKYYSNYKLNIQKVFNF